MKVVKTHRTRNFQGTGQKQCWLTWLTALLLRLCHAAQRAVQDSINPEILVFPDSNQVSAPSKARFRAPKKEQGLGGKCFLTGGLCRAAQLLIKQCVPRPTTTLLLQARKREVFSSLLYVVVPSSECTHRWHLAIWRSISAGRQVKGEQKLPPGIT